MCTILPARGSLRTLRTGGEDGRIRTLNASTGEFEIESVQTIGGRAVVSVSFMQLISVDPGESFIDLDANFLVSSGFISAAALPGYADASIVIAASAEFFGGPSGGAGRAARTLGRISAPVFWGLGAPLGPMIGALALTFRIAPSSVNQALVLLATITSTVGVGGWARAEASIRGRFEGFAVFGCGP